MIKFETNNGKNVIEMKGTASTLFTDICIFIKGFHNAIKEDSKEVADFFEWFIRNELGHTVFDVMKDDEPKKEKKEDKKDKEDIADDLDELINSLNELLKIMKK